MLKLQWKIEVGMRLEAEVMLRPCDWQSVLVIEFPGLQFTPLPAFPSPQVLAILLILRERHLGVKSSGIQFVFWMVLLVYEVIRLRSMSLIHQDDLVRVGRGGVGQHKTNVTT